MTLWLVRHGETAWSLTGQHTGRTDLALTANGQAQARRLLPRLRRIEFAHVWVSPRQRARQTCALAGLAASSRVEPDLAEWDYGAYEGRRSVDIRAERADWNIWRDGCPGGETPAALGVRADRLIARLAALKGDAVLFSHGHFSAALAARWIGLAPLEAQHLAGLLPASLSALGEDRGTRVIQLWNEGPSNDDTPGAR